MHAERALEQVIETRTHMRIKARISVLQNHIAQRIVQNRLFRLFDESFERLPLVGARNLGVLLPFFIEHLADF
jgi:hypothetical protein